MGLSQSKTAPSDYISFDKAGEKSEAIKCVNAILAWKYN